MHPKLHRLIQGARNFRRIAEVFRAQKCLKNGLQLSLEYILKGRLNYPYRVQTKKGGIIDLADWTELTTIWRVFCAGEYILPAQAKLIVDLGANIGAFSLFASELTAARIIAVEPFPSTYRRLSQTIANNQLNERVSCLQAAIHSHDGNVSMNGEEAIHSYARQVSDRENPNSVLVPSMTLNTLLSEYRIIDFLKVDIEGAEYGMIQSSSDETLRKCRMIAMEYHDAARKNEIWERLTSIGFECTDHRPEGWAGLATFTLQRN